MRGHKARERTRAKSEFAERARSPICAAAAPRTDNIREDLAPLQGGLWAKEMQGYKLTTERIKKPTLAGRYAEGSFLVRIFPATHAGENAKIQINNRAYQETQPGWPLGRGPLLRECCFPITRPGKHARIRINNRANQKPTLGRR